MPTSPRQRLHSGFQKQMSEIGASAGANTPLAKLCEDTLSTIGTAGPDLRQTPTNRFSTEHLADAAKAVGGTKKA